MSASGTTSEKPKKVRLHYLDLAKGFAMLLVVWNHAMGDVWQQGIWYPLDHVEIPLFFIIAGLTWRNPADFRSWLRRKWHRIGIPYLFFLALGFLPFLPLIVRHFSPHDVAYAALTSQYNLPLWFLRAFVWDMLIYVALQKLLRNYMWWIGLVCAALCAVGLWGGMFHQSHPASSLGFWLVQLSLFPGFVCLPFLWLGNLIATRYPLKARIAWSRWMVVGVLLCGVVWFATAQPGLRLFMAQVPGNIALFFICAVSGCLTVLALCVACQRLPLINWIGRYSLVVFGVHFPVIWVCKLALGWDASWGTLAITLVASLLLTWALTRWWPTAVGEQPQRGHSAARKP